MCGIIGYFGPQNPKGVLLDGLKRLEYRGYDSAGVAIHHNGNVEVYRCEGRISNLEEKLTQKQFSGAIGIGHTRWATHGAPTELNAHPHRSGSITLVHNGIIENYAEHKERVLKLGRKVASDTDTEIVAHLLDIEVQGGATLEKAIVRVLPKLRGSYAFVVLNDREPDTLAGIRNGAPLLVGIGKKEAFIASDVQAILHRTNQIIYLEDGQFAVCKSGDVRIFDVQGKAIKPVVKTVNWTPDQMDKQGYRHYMLKEIHEQSQAIANTINGNVDHATGVLNLRELTGLEAELAKVETISIVACGTARHAGLVGKYYLEKFARVPVEVDYASEFRYRNPVLNEKALLILISQSGETADTLAALREGKRHRVRTLTICNVRDSTLARESDVVIYTNAGPEIGVASTKAFTTQLTVLYMLAVQLGSLRRVLKPEEARKLTSELLTLPIHIDKTLQLESTIESVATDHQNDTFFFYMGRGIHYPIALEGALKLKEISYLLAEGYPAGELKHGPIALVDRRTVVIALSPTDPDDPSHLLYEKQMSNLQEVKARGGKIISIGTEGDRELPTHSRHFLGVPQVAWALSPIVLSIPVQLLAYHIASLRGTDVDKPRNLAKSVTVE